MGRVSRASLHPTSMQHTEHSACRDRGGRRDKGERGRREKKGKGRKDEMEEYRRGKEKDGWGRLEDKEGARWNERTGEGEGPLLVQRRTGGFGALVEVPELGVVLCQRTRTGGARRVGGHRGQTRSPMGRGRGRQDKCHEIQ